MEAEKITYHEFSDHLDSSEAFEGPEKTLRVFFKKPTKPQSETALPGLLDIPRSEWEAMLDRVKCKVLSVLIHPKVHAYVLSESSLFVYADHIILKTCGTTTLLEGLPAILEIVEKFYDLVGLEDPVVESSLYSRRSFFKPEQQPRPHSRWEDEVDSLKQAFPDPRVACYFGTNRDERWHFFSHANQYASNRRLTDGWIELMMTGIDTELAGRFHQSPESMEDSVMSLDSVASISSRASSVGADPDDDDPGHLLGNVMTQYTGIDELFRTNRQLIDSFAFTPCGYSCNGVLLDSGDYFTIHVTPQSGFSYASFEANVLDPGAVESGLTHRELVDRVLKVFSPQKFTLAICNPGEKKLLDPRELADGGYACTAESGFDTGNACLSHYILEKQ